MKIKVTQEHIAKAQENPDSFSGGCCPVAQAFMEAFNTTDVYIGISTARVNSKQFKLSDSLQHDIEHYLYSNSRDPLRYFPNIEYDVEEE